MSKWLFVSDNFCFRLSRKAFLSKFSSIFLYRFFLYNTAFLHWWIYVCSEDTCLLGVGIIMKCFLPFAVWFFHPALSLIYLDSCFLHFSLCFFLILFAAIWIDWFRARGFFIKRYVSKSQRFQNLSKLSYPDRDSFCIL